MLQTTTTQRRNPKPIQPLLQVAYETNRTQSGIYYVTERSDTQKMFPKLIGTLNDCMSPRP